MKEVEVNGKTYKIIKRYPHFTLCEDENGFKTGFNDFDLGLIEKRYIMQIKKEQNGNDKLIIRRDVIG